MIDLVQLHSPENGDPPLFACSMVDATTKRVLIAGVEATSKKVAKKEAAIQSIVRLWEIKSADGHLTEAETFIWQAYQSEKTQGTSEMDATSKLEDGMVDCSITSKTSTPLTALSPTEVTFKENEEAMEIEVKSKDDGALLSTNELKEDDTLQTTDSKKLKTVEKEPIEDGTLNSPHMVSHYESQVSSLMLLNQLVSQKKITVEIEIHDIVTTKQPSNFECVMTLNSKYKASACGISKKKAKALAAEKIIQLAADNMLITFPSSYRGRFHVNTSNNANTQSET